MKRIPAASLRSFPVLILRDPKKLPASCAKTALAIGNFDGFHLGHQAVIRTMCERASEKNLTPAVLTFAPHPRLFFGREQGPLRIEPFRMKAARLRRAGVKLLVISRFNQTLAGKTAEEFTNEILVNRLNVAELITGENFMFGKNRSGDSVFLREKSKQGVFGYTAVPSVKIGDISCSSTALRKALSEGSMAQAALLLGRPYETMGRVQHGDGRGKNLGAATANIKLTTIFQPRRGVYAVRFRQESDSRWMEGVANFGVRPTFGGTEPVLEIHGFDVKDDLYEKRINVEWLEFIRDEIAFPSVEALKNQITQDIAKTKKIFQKVAS